MNISPAALGAFLLISILIAWWRPELVLAEWLFLVLAMPTLRTMLGSAPVYWYDLVMLVLLWAFYRKEGMFHRWPIGVPKWHLTMPAAWLLLGFLLPAFRHSQYLVPAWIWGHSSCAIVAYGVGVHVMASPRRVSYERAILWGVVASGVILLMMCLIQFGNVSGSIWLNKLLYRDIYAATTWRESFLKTGFMARRANGPHFWPTTMAGMCVLGGLLALKCGGSSKPVVQAAAVAMLLAACTLTVSRHALLAVFLFAVVFLAFGSARQRWAAVVLSVCLGLVGGAGRWNSSWSSRLAKGGLEDTNIQARLIQGPERLWNLILTHPDALLVGAGQSIEKVNEKSHLIDPVWLSGGVSNSFLLPLFYMGIPGFLIYLWFWTTLATAAFRTPGSPKALSCAAIAAGMVLVLSDNYAFIYEPAVAFLTMVGGLVAGEQFALCRRAALRAGAEPAAVSLPVSSRNSSRRAGAGVAGEAQHSAA